MANNKKMKDFRNILVHSKSKKISETHEIPDTYPNKFIPVPQDNKKNSIFSFSTIENAEKFQKIVDEIYMIWLHNSRVLKIDIDLVGHISYEELK